MLYQSGEINDILTKAGTTKYKLQEKSDRLKIFGDSDVLDREILLINSLKKTVQWSKDNLFTDADTHKLAAYLLHKVDGYGFNGIIPYYASVSTTTSGSAGSGFQRYAQWVVGTGGSPAVNATTFTDSNLIGRYIELYADGVLLPVGLTAQASYTYNISTGQITFNYNLPDSQVITVFTYIPSLSGWTLFLETTVGGVIANGATSYTSASLIGLSVAVIVGVLLPVGLSGTLSYTFNSLTGTITWNEPLVTGQVVKIYTY